MAAPHWHTSWRLRHLESVSARNLLLPDTDPPPLAYFSLSVPTGGGGQCCAVYRSEAVSDDLNPEWMPLSWPPELQLAGQAGKAVLAVHQLPAGSKQAPALRVPQLWEDADGPAFRLQLREQAMEAEACQPAEAGLGLGSGEDSPGTDGQLAVAVRGKSAGPQHAGGPEANAAQQPGEAASGPANAGQPVGDAISPADEVGAGQAAEGQGSIAGPAGSLEEAIAAPGQPSSDAILEQQQQQQQGEAQPALPEHQQGEEGEGQPATPQEQQQEQVQQQQERREQQQEPPGSAAADEPSQAQASPVPEQSLEQLQWCAPPALGGFPSDMFPGKLLAVWALDLNHLHAVGNDLGALREPLGPNNVVLEIEGTYYVHPPPRLPEVPMLTTVAPLSASGQSSPTKRGSLSAAAGERLPPSSPAGSAPRRFASMLMSKLLRSTPNLQEGAEGRLYESDAESDVASEASGWTRLTSQTATREGAGPSLAFTKAMSLSDLRLHITALVSLRASVLELHAHALELRGRLGRLVEARQRAREQEAQLRQAQQDAQRSRQRAHLAKQRLGQVHGELAGAGKAASVRAQALVTTLRVMQAADRKLRDAQEHLQGDQGRERLVGLHRELVARRCLMVSQLGRAFQLGPVTVKVPEAPPGGYLEDRLEQQWVGSSGGSGSAAGGRRAGGEWQAGGSQEQGAVPSPLTNGSAVDTPRQYRQEVHLTIAGIELRPAVWRAAFDDSAGADITAADDELAAVALGYVAHFVDRLAEYLDVPLRYPLCLLGSKSSIYDGSPPCGTWSVEEPAKRSLFGRSEPSSDAAASAGRPTQYPLYCASRRERPQFAIGVFLLNKDIVQLLQTHGISAGGPNQLLHNLFALLQAARSALPPGS